MVSAVLENDPSKGGGAALLKVDLKSWKAEESIRSKFARERNFSVSIKEARSEEYLQETENIHSLDLTERFFKVEKVSLSDDELILSIPQAITQRLVKNFFVFKVKAGKVVIPDLWVQATSLTLFTGRSGEGEDDTLEDEEEVEAGSPGEGAGAGSGDGSGDGLGEISLEGAEESQAGEAPGGDEADISEDSKPEDSNLRTEADREEPFGGEGSTKSTDEAEENEDERLGSEDKDSLGEEDKILPELYETSDTEKVPEIAPDLLKERDQGRRRGAWSYILLLLLIPLAYLVFAFFSSYWPFAPGQGSVADNNQNQNSSSGSQRTLKDPDFFISGCWAAADGLMGGEQSPEYTVDYTYCFTSPQEARVTISDLDENGKIMDVCTTTAVFYIIETRLILQEHPDGPVCQKSADTSYHSSILACELSSDLSADCSITNQGSNSSISAIFRRLT
jgi:hypothetical protein